MVARSSRPVQQFGKGTKQHSNLHTHPHIPAVHFGVHWSTFYTAIDAATQWSSAHCKNKGVKCGKGVKVTTKVSDHHYTYQTLR